MISKRFMVTAKDKETINTVEGYYYQTQGFNSTTVHLIHNIQGTENEYVVFPETIEPVAVPIHIECGYYFCPNCKQDFSNDPDYKWNYCHECGQRLDWSGDYE